MDNLLIQKYKEKMNESISYLQKKKNILFLTTSNRWSGEKGGELAKSTQLAYTMQQKIGQNKVHVIDVTKLKIYPCEGNVSTRNGNTCGYLKAKLKDPEKNPSGHHRCWASLNNQDDELWKISKALLDSDAVVFFGSVRWGQMNSFYQKLIERLTWLENRHSTLGEENILKNIDAGIIIINQNWNGQEVLKTQKEVLSFYGFRVPDALSWNWQYSEDPSDESNDAYSKCTKAFEQIFLNKNL